MTKPEGGQSLHLRVRQLLANFLKFELEEVKLDSRLKEDLGVDSVDIVDIAGELESQLGIGLTDAEMSSVQTVRDVGDLIERKRSVRPSERS